MLSFKAYIGEQKYPMWIRATVAALILKIRKLSKQIDEEQNLEKQIVLIAQQNKLLSYISGLGIAIGANDTAILNRIRRLR
jgi:hypothetical protein